ncbi:MAG: hypothetical protein D5R97_03195 [Candidatus Syntrophonatronum acetioxidans]|uniref:Tetrapyrrole methylase domain-containing protein n=1 Tax=Candidatus Syntrophonatronum acetioxidans TaxID=1795816 RepID=A0A424YGI0_9FIRM|nr:MAG: hypothetical protein D5R97_03195 [Candidatus Syntrophonatronum acetioxidans]
MEGKLYVLGMGPGDPELMTIKALGFLKKADIIMAIKTDKEKESKVRPIVSYHLEGFEEKYYEYLMPTKGRCQNFIDCFMELGRNIYKNIKKGNKVAFLIPGDPLIFSIYSYLVDIIEDEFGKLPTEVVPGVISLSEAASIFKMPLAMEKERVGIIHSPSHLDDLPSLLQSFDTLALLEVQISLEKIKERLKELELLEKAFIYLYSQERNQYRPIKKEEETVEIEPGDKISVIIKD